MASIIALDNSGIIIEISYCLQIAGSESILFIHGLGSDKECFKYVWNYPEFRKYTILTYDLPGFGDSDKPGNFDYTMENMSAITGLLVKALNLQHVHVVGHSMGGAIGLLLLREIESAIESFFCLEGNLVSEDCTGSREAARYSFSDFITHGFLQLKSNISRNEDKSFIDSLNKNDAAAFYKSSESLVKWSDSGKLLELFLGLSIPKYYFFGELNKGAAVIKKLSTVPKVMIPRAGHGMMTDNPLSFYGELLKCLKQVH